MNKIEVQDGQNIIDIALQYYGSVEGVVAIAKDNDLSVTAETLPKTLKIDEANVVSPDMVSYFREQKVIVNTGQ